MILISQIYEFEWLFWEERAFRKNQALCKRVGNAVEMSKICHWVFKKIIEETRIKKHIKQHKQGCLA